jgi:uncharacterized protein YktB (UPF0637 family)
MFTITDTEIMPSDVLIFKEVRVNSKWFPDTGVCEIYEINSDHTQQDIEDNYDTWKSEYKTAEENKVDVKASAKAKLIAGEPLTEEEADTIVL